MPVTFIRTLFTSSFVGRLAVGKVDLASTAGVLTRCTRAREGLFRASHGSEGDSLAGLVVLEIEMEGPQPLPSSIAREVFADFERPQIRLRRDNL